MEKDKKAIIIGAGPAGLTAAYQMLKSTDVHPIVLETTGDIGGISKTLNHHGNRIDIGGHRFFSKNDEIMKWWLNIMPLQNKQSLDQLIIGETQAFTVLDNRQTEVDPEQEDNVMLLRKRISRIYYLRKFFLYPIALSWQTIKSLGLRRTLNVGVGYIISLFHKREELSLEDFYINRFGKPLYKMFFEDYTKKVWGVHPSKLGADWGAQRVKGISLLSLVLNIIKNNTYDKEKDFHQKDVETSLIEKFLYPKYGPGQLWEKVGNNIIGLGGEIHMNTHVDKINIQEGKVTSVEANGKKYPCNFLLSSMPLKDLVAAINGIEIPKDVERIASALPYRDFIMVGLLVDKLKIQNLTKIKTYENRIPDTWIYIQERGVKIGRIQVFNNWSPYMVSDYRNKMWIGLEYFCSEGDEMWNACDAEFIKMAINELIKIDILEDCNDVKDSVRIKIKKAYPAYYGSYYEIEKLKTFLDSIPNLYCVGRNGQHRYNNMDHSILTAMEAVKNIKFGIKTKANIWSVNTEKEYHEEK